MRLFLPGLCSIFLLCCISCNKYQPANSAFFFKSSNISVATSSEQGSGSSKITDLWLYVNGEFKGAYPVGNIMPVQARDKAATLNIYAGIKNNGIGTTRVYYQLYEPLKIDTFAPANAIIDRPLVFKYRSAVKFPWVEDFSTNVGYSIRRSDISDTTFQIASASDSYDGRSLELGLKGTDVVAQVESSGDGFILPSGNENVYLELNYKGDSWFSVGLIDAQQKLREVIILAPQESWNKTYISLAEAVSAAPVSSKYKLYFKLIKNDDNASPRIFLDNIKVVYI